MGRERGRRYRGDVSHAEKNGGGPRRPGVGRAAATALVVALLAAALLLPGDDNPNATRIVARLVGATVMILALLAYLGAERRRARTADGLGGTPPASEGTPAGGGDRPEPATEARPRDGGADLEGMLLHADDALLALSDLAAHGDAGEYGLLPALLGRTNVAGWEGPRPVRANRLRRNGRWWLRPASEEVPERAYDELLAIEATLNVWDEMRSRRWPEKMTEAWRVAQVLSDVVDLRPHEGSGATLRAALLDGVDADGEWGLRVRLANDVEDLPAPFRVEATFRANLPEGLVGLSVTVPRPASFTVVEPGRRAAWARAYALRLSLLLARRAFASSPRVSRVAVCCHEHGGDATVLSLDLRRADLDRLLPLARRASLVDEGLPGDACLRLALDETGWLAPVEPLLDPAGRELCPAGRYREPELDPTPCDPAVERACGARRVRDLSIMERAGRVAAWAGVEHELGNTTQQAVSRLVSLRDETSDTSVAEACDRACRALVEGAVDAADRHGLAELFVDGHPLGVAVRRARAALAGSPSPDEVERALAALESALSPLEESGAYLDERDRVFRYFNSLPERVSYNLSHRDDPREVVLVPDEYYMAQSYAVRLLGALGRHEEALARSEELVRVAPVTPDAALSKARCLENLSRIFEAADLLARTVRASSTAQDMAVCFYRLAYMEWRLGRSDLSVACYQRAISLHERVAGQAAEELSDLLETQPGLQRLADDEVVPALAAGGLPVGDVDVLRKRTRDAAAACADAGLLAVARPLTAALLELCRDDALVGVYRSLSQP